MNDQLKQATVVDPKIHRMVVLASRAKTRVKEQGKRGLTDASEEEVWAMAFFCDLFLADYTGPLTKGEPDLPLIPTPEVETTA
jgi:hypothetical protein